MNVNGQLAFSSGCLHIVFSGDVLREHGSVTPGQFKVMGSTRYALRKLNAAFFTQIDFP